jgi:5-methylcytosine-specific restriction endonuclease McrA
MNVAMRCLRSAVISATATTSSVGPTERAPDPEGRPRPDRVNAPASRIASPRRCDVPARGQHGGVPQLGRADRLDAVLRRDGATCVWCGRPFTGLVLPTTEHVVPRLKGGPSWLENEVAACRRCNAGRGHRSPVEWLEECRRRGWAPDEERLARALGALAEAIAREGGQRRARPYLAGQLRRMRGRTGR